MVYNPHINPNTFSTLGRPIRDYQTQPLLLSEYITLFTLYARFAGNCRCWRSNPTFLYKTSIDNFNIIFADSLNDDFFIFKGDKQKSQSSINLSNSSFYNLGRWITLPCFLSKGVRNLQSNLFFDCCLRRLLFKRENQIQFGFNHFLHTSFLYINNQSILRRNETKTYL